MSGNSRAHDLSRSVGRAIIDVARNWRLLLTDEVRRFVLGHEDDDLAKLALTPSPFASELRMLVLDQIKARQKARKKLPGWHRVPGIVFPRSALVEQASSEATGAYKSRLAQGGRFVDFTAGVAASMPQPGQGNASAAPA